MNRIYFDDLVNEITNEVDLPKKQVQLVFNKILTGIINNLTEGKEIQLKHLGIFYLSQRKITNAYVHFTKSSDKYKQVPAIKKLCFKPSEYISAKVKFV